MHAAILAALFSCLLPLSRADAQLLVPGSDAYLKVEPQAPAPGQSVNVSVEAYSVDLTGADIRWYVDGSERADGRGARAIAVTASNLGQPVAVRADVATRNDGTLSLSTSIFPSILDTIVEADTYVPPFYKGRALPAAGEPVSVTVVPYLGGNTNSGGLVYTWRLGSTVLFGGPVVGKTHATFTMPKSQSVLSIQITTAGGAVVGEKSITLKPAHPDLQFYEDNPLRGLGFRAIGPSLVLSGDETTVRAEPYFVAKNIFSLDPAVGWTIGGQTAPAASAPNVITLQKTGESGSAEIEFSLTNRQSLLQAVRGSFTLLYE
jgi:hypothetical protein